jgi:hypothetical protein
MQQTDQRSNIADLELLELLCSSREESWRRNNDVTVRMINLNKKYARRPIRSIIRATLWSYGSNLRWAVFRRNYWTKHINLLESSGSAPSWNPPPVQWNNLTLFLHQTKTQSLPARVAYRLLVQGPTNVSAGKGLAVLTQLLLTETRRRNLTNHQTDFVQNKSWIFPTLAQDEPEYNTTSQGELTNSTELSTTREATRC